jgi:hypothetical protein
MFHEREPVMRGKVIYASAIALVALVCHARPSVCQENAEDSKEEAKKYFNRGVVLFKAGDAEGALENFLTSYEMRPNWKLKLNIGLCLYKLGRYAEAGNALETFLLKEGDSFPENVVEQVMDLLDDIKAKTGIIQIKVDEAGANVELDGKSLGESPIAVGIYVKPGEYKVRVEAKDGRQWSGKVKIGADDTKLVSVTLASSNMMEEAGAPEKKAGAPEKKAGAAGREKVGKVLFYTSLALAAATALGGAIGGGVAMQKAGELDDLDEKCEAEACDNVEALHAAYLEEAQDVYRVGENAGNASTGLFVTACVFAAASLASLFVWKPWAREKAAGSGFKLLPAEEGGLVLILDF